MLTKNKFQILILLIPIIIIGCSPKFYSPNSHNVPLMNQKGEGTVSLGLGSESIELRGAYAPSDKYGLLFNGVSKHPKDDSTGDGGSGKIFELGLGYIETFSYGLMMDVYLLLGMGSVENHFPSTLVDHPGTTGKLESTVYRYGVQPSLGFKSKYLDAALSSRFSVLHYNNVKGSLIFNNESQQDYLIYNDNNLLFEPAATLRVGYDFIKLHIQLGKSYNLNNSEFKMDDGHLVFGLGYYRYL